MRRLAPLTAAPRPSAGHRCHRCHHLSRAFGHAADVSVSSRLHSPPRGVRPSPRLACSGAAVAIRRLVPQDFADQLNDRRFIREYTCHIGPALDAPAVGAAYSLRCCSGKSRYDRTWASLSSLNAASFGREASRILASSTSGRRVSHIAALSRRNGTALPVPRMASRPALMACAGGISALQAAMLSISRTDPNRAATISLAPGATCRSANMVTASTSAR